jgi:hypothetical protein
MGLPLLPQDSFSVSGSPYLDLSPSLKMIRQHALDLQTNAFVLKPMPPRHHSPKASNNATAWGQVKRPLALISLHRRGNLSIPMEKSEPFASSGSQRV